jgi:hypothetical protein
MIRRKHELLTDAEREILFGIPTERDLLARLYTFEPSDIDIIGARREKRNQLGAALQLGLVTVLRRSPERLELATGDRRDDQAFRRVQA